MKKYVFASALCALALASTSCGDEISLTNDQLCIYSNGKWNKSQGNCSCADESEPCAKGIFCQNTTQGIYCANNPIALCENSDGTWLQDKDTCQCSEDKAPCEKGIFCTLDKSDNKRKCSNTVKTPNEPQS